MVAEISYSIKSIRILDTTYTVGEELSEEELMEILETEYPFKFDFEIDNSSVDISDGISNFTISLYWPYESGDDELDTQIGNLAYEYNQNNPDEKSIQMELELKATQVEQ